MTIAYKLAVLAVLAIAATAPGAFAQTEPLVHNQTPELTVTAEPTGVPCPAVTPSPAPNPGPMTTAGGCRIHVTGNSILLTVHVFGIESTDATCSTELDGRIDASGEGYVTHVELVQAPQGSCTRRPCGASTQTPEGRAWSAYGRETAPGVRAVTVLYCLWPLNGTTTTHCEITIPFAEPTNHRIQGVANDTPCHGFTGFRGEHTGTWNIESTLGTTGEGQLEQHVEINHT